MCVGNKSQANKVLFLKLILIVILFTQQAFTADPQPNAFYTAIWPGEVGSVPAKDAALICYNNVLALPDRIENTTKHVLKHMTFPRAAGETVPRCLLCWVVPEGANGRRNAEAARSIIADLYETGGSVANINRLIGTIATHTSQQISRYQSAIDAIVAHSDKIKKRLGFPDGYVYVANTQPVWTVLVTQLSPYEIALRDKEAVRRFIGTWHSDRPDKYGDIPNKLDIQAAYFTAVTETMPVIMTCFRYCIKKILENAFTEEGHITKITPQTRPAGILPPMSTALFRQFQDGQYAGFAKAVSGAVDPNLPGGTVSIDREEVQTMANNTKISHIKAVIGHELRDNPQPTHYETDIRTVYVASGGG